MSQTKAIAREQFDGAPDGSAFPVRFTPGMPVSGHLADVAIGKGWAEEATEEEYAAAVAAHPDEDGDGIPDVLTSPPAALLEMIRRAFVDMTRRVGFLERQIAEGATRARELAALEERIAAMEAAAAAPAPADAPAAPERQAPAPAAPTGPGKPAKGRAQ